MEQVIYLDFWDRETILSGLSRIYNVSEAEILYWVNAYDEENRLSAFFELSKIHPDTYPLDNIMVRCKLIGKYPDKTQLEQYGLLPLTKILNNKESFLAQFLRDNGILIDIENGIFTYMGKSIRIGKNDELGGKLYHDKGEVEAFYCGEQEEMVGYSTIKDYPEILETLEWYVHKRFKVHPMLGNKWSDLVTGYDQISFYVDLKDTSYVGGCDEEWSDALPYEAYYENEYPYTDSYPKLLYQNLWLLNTGFYVLDGGIPERFIGIKDNVNLPYSILDIKHFEDKG